MQLPHKAHKQVQLPHTNIISWAMPLATKQAAMPHSRRHCSVRWAAAAGVTGLPAPAAVPLSAAAAIRPRRRRAVVGASLPAAAAAAAASSNVLPLAAGKAGRWGWLPAKPPPRKLSSTITS